MSGPGGGFGGGRVAPPRHCYLYPSTVRLPCQPSAGGAIWDTHTNTNTLYTASSSIQAPFGWPANAALVVHFGTHTRTPTHSTLLVVAYKHPSAGLPTQRWWCMRWNVCASAVRSCYYMTMRDNKKKKNTTHKHFTSYSVLVFVCVSQNGFSRTVHYCMG